MRASVGAVSRALAASAVLRVAACGAAACGGAAPVVGGAGTDDVPADARGTGGAEATPSGGEAPEGGARAEGAEADASGSGSGAEPGVSAADDPALSRARALFAEGLAAYQAGRLDEARARLDDAYRLRPSAELAFNVARVCERMGEAEQGIAYFQLYLRDGAPGEGERADVARRIAGLEALRARQRDQIFAAPASTDELTAEARTFFLRGVAMFQRRAFEAAMQAFTAAYGFARLPEVVYNLAITAEKLDRAQEAIDYYREFLRARPEDPSRATIEARVRALRGGR